MADLPPVSICIITRNRKKELLDALGSCFAQAYEPLEVLVFDGASTDGTEEAVRDRYPRTRFIRVEDDPGFPALRNRAIRAAGGEYVVSLDDDAYFTSGETIRQLVEDFQAHPHAAAVAMPFIAASGPGTAADQPARAQAPLSRLRTIVGCAHALRRAVALELGPYREIPSYQKEDRDLSIRLLDRGHAIIYGRTAPIVHVFSSKRDWDERYGLAVHSSLLFDYLNIPQPYVLPRMVVDAMQLLAYKFAARKLAARLRFIGQGFAACARTRAFRRPVSRTAYRLYRSLPAHGAEPWSDAIPGPAVSP